MRQLGHVHQAVDLGFVQLDEQPEAGDAADHAVEYAAHVLFHPRRAVAVVDLARGLVGAPALLRALQGQAHHLAVGVLEAVRLLARQRVLDGAVHQQVRVAADGRGEVRVRIQRQAEVANVLHRVHRQALAAQQDGLDQRPLRALAHAVEQVGEVLGTHPPPGRHPQLELLEELQQVQVLGFGRLVVDAVRRRDVGLQQELRRLHVGGDHAFLDQLVGVVALEHAGAHHLAAVVEFEAHFGGLELDRPAPRPRARQRLVQAVQVAQLRHELADFLLRLRVVFADRVPHLGVGETRVRVHHRLVELRLVHGAVAAHAHVAHEAQPVDPGLERADAVGERLGQHRDHVAGEIHAGGAQLRLVVQRLLRAHVMRDVGNGHHQPEPVAVGLAVHGVVEVLGVLAVDGHQRQLAQVAAAADLRVADINRDGGSLVQHLLREFERQPVAVDGGLHHQRRLEHVAQHRQHASDRRAVGIGRVHDLAHHQLAVLRVLGGVVRDLDVAQDPLVVGHHEADARFHVEAAQQPGRAALKHLGDHALTAAAGIHAGHAGHDPVAVHGLAHFIRRQEQVVAGAGVRAQEAEAVGIGDDGAGDQLHLARRHVAAAAVAQQLAVADHRAQALFQRVKAVGLGQPEHRGDFLGLLRSFGLGQGGQDRFAAGDRVFVTAGLAFRVGVLDPPLGIAPRFANVFQRLAASRRCAGHVGHPGRKLPAAGALVALSLAAGGFTAVAVIF